jgi:hypothetical protein
MEGFSDVATSEVKGENKWITMIQDIAKDRLV